MKGKIAIEKKNYTVTATFKTADELQEKVEKIILYDDEFEKLITKTATKRAIAQVVFKYKRATNNRTIKVYEVIIAGKKIGVVYLPISIYDPKDEAFILQIKPK